MFSYSQRIVNRIVLWTYANLLKYSHDAFVDLLTEQLDTSIGLRNSSCYYIERGRLSCSIGT